MLRRRCAESEPNALDAVFVTRNGTWHQVVNIERRWRAIRKDTGFDWVTPHTLRKTVATLVSEQVGSEEASRQLGHSSSQITLEHYIARPSVAADHTELLQAFADESTADQGPAQQTVEGPNPPENENVYDQ